MNKENNIISVSKEVDIIECDIDNIKKLIYTIRGQQVMLDNDVAMLYHYETKKVNQTVKRNIERFPEKFCFRLNEQEAESLRSQFVTLNKNGRGQHRKYLPYVFTEQGIAMLSGLLKNEIAVKVSISIMDAFVEMRRFITLNGQVFQEINNIKNKLLEHNDRRYLC